LAYPVAMAQNLEDPENRVNVDRVFDTCILLLTVLAAAEFAYLAYILPATETANLTQVNFFFRVTTAIIIMLVTIWVLLSLVPSPPKTWKLGFIGLFKRRYIKEFCWCLFGNLFAYEISIFAYFSFSTGTLVYMVYYSLVFAFLLALPATVQYRRLDHKPAQNPQKRRLLRWLIPLAEHIVIFVVSYIVLQQVMLLSVSVPIPAIPAPIG
jgi:hypothetical protein